MAGHVQRRFNEDGLGPPLSKFAYSNACREMNLGRESACAGGRRCICTPRLSSSTSLRSPFPEMLSFSPAGDFNGILAGPTRSKVQSV